MTTPILTKKQKRQSLSAKKGPAKGLRNILAQPVENYWPIVNIDQYPTLTTIMNELLPLIKRPTFKIPGSMLRHIPKEKRILARKEALEKEITKPDENILKSVILGVNAVTRALEKNDVCCILLDANVEPPLLIKHIIVMAQNKKIPILLLSVLKTVTLQKIGFATIAFALKHDVMESSDNVFHTLYKSIAEIFKDFKPPSQCSLQLFKSDEISEKGAMCKVETTKTEYDLISNTSKVEKPVVFTDIYKYRSSRKERVFIPPTENVNKDSEVTKTLSHEFIALSNDLSPVSDKNSINALKGARYVNIYNEKKESKDTKKDVKSFDKSEFMDNNASSLKHTGNQMPKKRKNNDNYLSLKIKRIQGNSNRTKATKFAKKKKK